MKRTVKRSICLLLCLLLTAFLCGCTLFPEVEMPKRSKTPEFTGNTEELSVGSPCKHYFEQLSETEKTAYNAILAEVSAFPERIEICELTKNELSDMYTALIYDNPELFFLSGESLMRQTDNHVYFYPDYRMDASEYDAMFRRCSEIASQIVTEAQKEQTAFDRERAVHDRLIAACSYTDAESDIFKGTIYGALCGGKAACEGYAKTAKFLLDMLGIPCFVVQGNSTPPGSRTESHMWNAVQLDGDWYYLDLTWDDPVLDGGGEVIRYTYFNVTDEVLGKTHADYDAGVVCSATRDNFFVHEDLLFSQFGSAESERAAAHAVRVLDAGSDGFQLCFADQTAYENAQKQLFDEQEVYDLLKQIAAETSRTIVTDRVSYYPSDEYYTLEIIPVQ